MPVRITAPIMEPKIDPNPPMIIMAIKSTEFARLNESGEIWVTT